MDGAMPSRTIGLVGLNLVRAFAVAMAFLIPVQGLAAMTASICMAFDHHKDSAVHKHSAQTHDEHAAHTHGDDTAAADATDAEGKHCGPCVACCASASIAASAAPLILSSSSEAPYILSQSAPPGVEPAGLYKPPLAL